MNWPNSQQANTSSLRRWWGGNGGTNPQARRQAIMNWAYSVMGVNGAVFAAWRLSEGRQWQTVLHRYFMSSAQHLRQGRWPSFILDAYSHRGIAHIGFNMMAFYSFARGLAFADAQLPTPFPLSWKEIAAMYTAGGTVGSLLSSAMPRALPIPGLGASNAISAMVTYQCMCFPRAQYSLMFIPMNGHDLLTVFTLANLILGWRASRGQGRILIDGFGHIGGSLVGAGFFAYKYQQAKQAGMIRRPYQYQGELIKKLTGAR